MFSGLEEIKIKNMMNSDSGGYVPPSLNDPMPGDQQMRGIGSGSTNSEGDSVVKTLMNSYNE